MSMELEFEWDSEKEKSNIEKHGVSFHEGATVLGDPFSWTFPDPDHSVGEERFLTIGLSAHGESGHCFPHGQGRQNAHHQRTTGNTTRTQRL